MIRKYYNYNLQTNPQQCEAELNNNHETPGRQTKKATSSLFSIQMIAKLEWTQRNAQQNVKQLKNPTMGVTINNKSTTTQPRP